MKIYFAHSFELRGTQEERLFIIQLKQKFPSAKIINPFEKETELEAKYDGEYYQNPNFNFAKDIIESDLDLLDSCDIICALIPEGNYRIIGTSMEIMYAWVKRKYVIVICEDKKRPRHPWLWYCANEFYSNREEFFQ